MGFNVTGTEVASGIHDPSTMFITVFTILIIGTFLYLVYYLLMNLK